MRKLEEQKPEETEIEWQSILEDTEDWTNTIEDFEELEESRDEQRRKEAMFEAADYEETEFEDAGFGNVASQKKNNDNDLTPRKPFPVWILPIVALIICIPLVILAQHQDANSQRVDKETEALLASANQKEQQTLQSQEGTATSEAEGTGESETIKEAEATRESEAQETEGAEETNASQETEGAESSTEARNPENTTVSGGDAEASYVSGDATMSFEEVNDVVSAIDATNLRMLPTTEGGGVIIAQLKRGQNIARTGINEETGWSRVSYHGQVLYAVTQYLTTDVSDAPLIDEPGTGQAEPLDISTIAFVDCDDYIKPRERVNLRTEPSTARGANSVRTQISNDVVLHRTGYTADGAWSRVEYNGESLYIINSYIDVVEAPQPQQ